MITDELDWRLTLFGIGIWCDFGASQDFNSDMNDFD